MSGGGASERRSRIVDRQGRLSHYFFNAGTPVPLFFPIFPIFRILAVFAGFERCAGRAGEVIPAGFVVGSTQGLLEVLPMRLCAERMRSDYTLNAPRRLVCSVRFAHLMFSKLPSLRSVN